MWCSISIYIYIMEASKSTKLSNDQVSLFCILSPIHSLLWKITHITLCVVYMIAACQHFVSTQLRWQMMWQLYFQKVDMQLKNVHFANKVWMIHINNNNTCTCIYQEATRCESGATRRELFSQECNKPGWDAEVPWSIWHLTEWSKIENALAACCLIAVMSVCVSRWLYEHWLAGCLCVLIRTTWPQRCQEHYLPAVSRY